MRFEKYRINSKLKENLAEAGFHKTTDIQYKAITPILQGSDVLAIAQTGTGKTAAFAIPLLEMAMKSRSNDVFAVVMVPTHELALQIEKVFNTLGKKLPVKCMAIIGGVDQGPQIKALDKGLDIIIATPGRVFDLRNQRVLDTTRLKVLVIDEADHMLDKGFIDDMKDIVQFMPKNRQTLFFSATIDEKIKKLANSLIKNAVKIHISPKNPVSKNVNHYVIFVEMDDKRFFLERFINENKGQKTLVFVRTKVRAERVKLAMERTSIETFTLHSDKEQKERKQIMSDFEKGNFDILIATDISARGVDIPNVEFVVNYDLPTEAENYVHRVGRTGRGRAKGKALSFSSSEETPLLEAIEDYIGRSIEEIAFSEEEYDKTLQLGGNQKQVSFKDIKKAMLQEEFFKKRRKKKK